MDMKIFPFAYSTYVEYVCILVPMAESPACWYSVQNMIEIDATFIQQFNKQVTTDILEIIRPNMLSIFALPMKIAIVR